MQPACERTLRDAVDHVNALAGDGAERIAIGIDRIVPHAHFGRGDVAFVAEDAEAWGQVDENSAAVEMHETRQPGDAELLNDAVVQTLLHDGSVFVQPRDAVPGSRTAAAILRY